MKTPQRTFVVEIKSSRRRLSTKAPSSIWGGTNLKKLVQEAENDAPHLFDSSLSPVSTNEGNNIHRTPDPVEAAQGVAEIDSSQSPFASSDFAGEMPVLQEDDGPPPTPIPLLSIAPRKKIARSTRRAHGPSRTHHAGGKPITSGEVTIAAQPNAYVDELVALDEENRRLKALLFEYILQENNQIRRMLARFS